MWTEIEEKLLDWEKNFAKLWLIKTRKYTDIDHEYLTRELPRLKAEKESVEIHLHKIEELMAKTKVLIDNLDEELCNKLTGSSSLAGTGQILLDHFGKKLQGKRSEGRKNIRKFLEDHYVINHSASRELFALLEEVRLLQYQVDIPQNLLKEPFNFGNMDLDMALYPGNELLLQLGGWWRINS
ncbi:MAG TPA: hypothetical protein ENH29_04645 [Bacteroidetes bacterium]|nr:hypothetical protein [Bacteroidota bacterium]